MGQIGVAEAARRLGVSVARVHQRITDGSLPAVRVGAQWVIDEAVLSPTEELSVPGRRLSPRSAWAVMAVGEGDEEATKHLAPSERSRARERLTRLLAAANGASSEAEVHSAAKLLRSVLRNRASRMLFRAAPQDLPDIRSDPRVAPSGLSHPSSGIASGDLIEGYVTAGNLDGLARDHLLSRADKDANVVLHVVPATSPDMFSNIGNIAVAVDLAEHSGPREEARAIDLLRQIGKRRSAAV